MKDRLLKLVGVGCLILALSGCHHKTTSTTPTTPVSTSSAGSTAAPSATCVIPQNNGGDHDADNNGGPDDGDGCDK